MKDELLSVEYLHSVVQRYRNATSGPWVSYVEGRDHLGGSNFIMRGEAGSAKDLDLFGATVADQDFIACARQDIPILLNEINLLRRMLGFEIISDL